VGEVSSACWDEQGPLRPPSHCLQGSAQGAKNVPKGELPYRTPASTGCAAEAPSTEEQIREKMRKVKACGGLPRRRGAAAAAAPTAGVAQPLKQAPGGSSGRGCSRRGEEAELNH
jgi:hypothetical protein